MSIHAVEIGLWIDGGLKHKKRNVEIALFVFIVCGAAGEIVKQVITT